MNRLIQYIIEAKDATAAGIQSAVNRVKSFGAKVSETMTRAKKDFDVGPVKEKVIKTAEVLKRMENGFARLCDNGEELSRVMNDLELELDAVNKGAKTQEEAFKNIKTAMEDLGANAKSVESGMRILKESIVTTKDRAAELGLDDSKFNPLRAATAALHGNFGQLGMQCAKLIPGFQNLGEYGTMAFAAVGAAVMGVFKLLSALKDLIAVAFNTDALPRDLSRASANLEGMKSAAENFYYTMDEARKESKTLADQFEASAEAINRMTKAQNDFNRAQELAKANTEEEKRLIDEKYDALNRSADAKKETDILGNRRKNLEDEKKRLEQELAQSKNDQDDSRRLMKRMNFKAGLYKTGVFGGMAESFSNLLTKGTTRNGNDIADAANTVYTKASNAYDDAVEKEEEIRKQLQKTAAALENLGREEKAAKLEQEKADLEAKTKKAEQEKRFRLKVEDDLARVAEDYEKAAYEYSKETTSEALAYKLQLLQEYYAELEKCENQEQVEELKKAKELADKRIALMREEEKDRQNEQKKTAAEAKKLAKEEQKERIALAKDELKENEQLSRDAYSRLKDAQKQVSTAWGWYKDKDKAGLKSKIAEEETNLAAQKQYQKDYYSLTHGRWSNEFAEAKELQRLGRDDKLEQMFAKWRKGSFGLSLEQEATMRVALAKDEEKNSYRDLADINEQTLRAAEALEEIKKAFTEGSAE